MGFRVGLWGERQVVHSHSRGFRPNRKGNPFGRVRGGFIKLTGRIKKCILAGHQLERLAITAEDGTALCGADMDTNESVSQAYCLLLSSCISEDAGVGLVLPLTSAERQEYRRLGLLMYTALSSLKGGILLRVSSKTVLNKLCS